MEGNKERMPEYIAGQLEESGLYSILTRDNARIKVRERAHVSEKLRTIDVLVHSQQTPVKYVAKTVAGNTDQQVYTAHLFLKDGKTFMVRLAERGKIKDHRSLKRYTKQEIDSMVHLRDLEKAVIRWSRHPQLAFYQPQTERLQEGIRIYDMHPVHLNYSHLQRGDNGFGFAKNGFADDFRMPVEIGGGNGPIVLVTGDASYTAGISVPEKPVEAVQGKLL